MPLEVIQRLIGLLIGGFLPTDKQVNHILTPYMTYFYAHRLGSSIHDGVCRKKPIYNAQSRQSSRIPYISAAVHPESSRTTVEHFV
jgi:hypothetical protein